MRKKTDHPLFRLWCNRRNNCNNPNNSQYHHYGARGIKFCTSWNHDFWAFADYMDFYLGPRPKDHVLDRIDNNKGFTPGNLRWATRQEDSNNRRNNHTVTYKGRTQTFAEWSRELGAPLTTLWSRIHDRGMSVHKAFTIPIKSHTINKRKKKNA